MSTPASASAFKTPEKVRASTHDLVSVKIATATPSQKHYLFDSLLPFVARISSMLLNICLGFMAAYYTAAIIGWPISLFFVFITVANELIDMIVQTDPTVEGRSKLPSYIEKLELHKKPFGSLLLAVVLIAGGVWQNGVRMFMFAKNFLLNQSMFVASQSKIFLGAVFVGASAVLFNFANFVINFRKMWKYEINKEQEVLEQASVKDTAPKKPGFFARYLINPIRDSYKHHLNNNTWWFDKVVGLSMVCGAALYFICDFTNLVNLSKAFVLSSATVPHALKVLFGFMTNTSLLPFGIMPGAVLHGAYAWFNQMVLWGFNNKKFHVQNFNKADDGATVGAQVDNEIKNRKKTEKLWLVSLFHLGPNTRRIVLYLREFIMCVIDIFNAMLIVPILGFYLGVATLVATMLCRWVVYYFQSRKEPIDDSIKPGTLAAKVEGIFSKDLAHHSRFDLQGIPVEHKEHVQLYLQKLEAKNALTPKAAAQELLKEKWNSNDQAKFHLIAVHNSLSSEGLQKEFVDALNGGAKSDEKMSCFIKDFTDYLEGDFPHSVLHSYHSQKPGHTPIQPESNPMYANGKSGNEPNHDSVLGSTDRVERQTIRPNMLRTKAATLIQAILRGRKVRRSC